MDEAWLGSLGDCASGVGIARAVLLHPLCIFIDTGLLVGKTMREVFFILSGIMHI